MLKSSKPKYKTKVIRADLLDFDFDFEDIIIFGKRAQMLCLSLNVDGLLTSP
jgi:hypothetical protein